MFVKLLLLLLLFLPTPVLAIDSPNLDSVNQKVTSRFNTDILRLAAIMDELKYREGIKETRVAFGGIDNQVKSADYWVTYTAEALAYQKAQKYSSESSLRSSLEILKGKILKAKGEVKKALDQYEK